MGHWWQIRRAEPGLPADELRRRRREGVIIAVTAVVFLVFAVLETGIPRVGNSSSQSGNLVFFFLINLNLILLVLLVFLVTRNLIKLALERRRGAHGSGLRTRLVLAFVGLSLVPSALLFMVSQGLLTAAFDAWFNVRVESSLKGSRDVAHSYYQFAADNALQAAATTGRRVHARGLLRKERQASLAAWVEQRRSDLNLATLAVFAADRSLAASVTDGTFSARAPDSPESLAELFDGRETTRSWRVGRGDLVRAGVPIRNDKGEVVGAVVVDSVVPRNVSQRARDITRAYQEYRQLAAIKQPIKNGYILTLALITLVVIFSATWFGLRQADAITVPLQRLAEGTREVAQGNWSHRIEAGGDEVTASLVESFNQMTADLQQIHSELVERRKYVESLLANIAAGVVSLSPAGAVTTINRAAEGMLGLRLVQVRGQSWAEAFGAPHLRKLREIIAEALAAPRREFERQVKLSGGDHVVTALVSATTLADDDGRGRGLILFFEDVTHLLRVQRMEAWREVARRLAHEIKNPLTPIQLSAQRLRKRYPALLEGSGETPTPFDDCTRTIIGQVDQLKRLVNEFSLFARLPAVEIRPEEINTVVEDALALFRQSHPEIAFEFRPATGLPLVGADRDALKRALVNVLDNAVAACGAARPAGGSSAKDEPPPRIEVTTTPVPARAAVRLEVADNGCGMSREVKLRLFEPYFSTKKDGTGLGLAIVAAVVADHQGYVRAQDNPPRGSRFVIDLPVWAGESQAPAAANA